MAGFSDPSEDQNRIGMQSAGQDLHTIRGKIIDDLPLDLLIRDHGPDLAIDVERNGPAFHEFVRLCQHDDLLSLARHVADSLRAHLILIGEAGLAGPSVHADEELIDPEVLHTLANHRAYHDLGVVLVDAAQKNDLEIGGAADVICYKGAVGNDRP